jgi:hypothetical protein
MALETVTNVGDLVVTNPTSSDPKSVGDDHLRNLKISLRNSFAGFAGNILVSGTDGGGADAYTLTPTTTLTAYSTKMLVEFTPNATNTGASTLNISGLGTKNIYSVAGAALTAGELVSGRYYLAAYDGTHFRLLSVTKAYIDALSVAAGNVPAGGSAGQVLAKNSATNYDTAWSTVTAPGLVLLATLTPTAATNIDFLSTFTSGYDNYLILATGLTVATLDSISLRLATGGSVDSGSNYYSQGTAVDTNFTTSATSVLSTGSILAAGKGASIEISIKNANDATNLKAIRVHSLAQLDATPTYYQRYRDAVYTAANAVSGFRLYLTGGNNFAATGKVYVYGYSKV